LNYKEEALQKNVGFFDLFLSHIYLQTKNHPINSLSFSGRNFSSTENFRPLATKKHISPPMLFTTF